MAQNYPVPMPTISIRPSSICEISSAPNFDSVCEEYARESAVPGMPVVKVRLDMYEAMEKAGNLYTVGAFDGENLAGFVVASIQMAPNYGALVAATNAFFVSAAHRKSGAGLRLLSNVEEMAAKSGALGILVGCPKDGPLAKVLAKKNYADVNRLFFRSLA